MAYTTVTYTFSNSTTADATQVNQNFTDLINGLSDGTKDLSVSALTAAGTSTLNGNVNLGNSSSDDLTITAALAGSISVKTTATYNVGSSTLGLLSIYLGGASSYTVRLLASASQSATYTLTLPTTAGTKGYAPYNSGSGALTWEPSQKGVNPVASADYTILDADGYYAILVTTGASDRTITLPAAANNTGRSILIKKVDSGVGYIRISGTIDGSATKALTTIYQSMTILSDGTSWHETAFDSAGEVIDQAGTSTADSASATDLAQITVRPGRWTVYGCVHHDVISSTRIDRAYAWTGITATTLTVPYATVFPNCALTGANPGDFSLAAPTNQVSFTTNTTMYLGAMVAGTALDSTWTAASYIRAVRIGS